MQTKTAHLDDGTILTFPEDTPDDVMDMAVKKHVLSMPQRFARKAVGLGEKALQFGTGAVAAPISGLAGIAAAMPGGRTPAEMVGTVGNALTYAPRTEEGQELGVIGKSLIWLEDKADLIGEVSGDPDDVLGATMVKTAILGAPALFGLKGPAASALRSARPKGKLSPTSESPVIGASGVTEAAQKVVTSTYQKWVKSVGKDRPVDIQYLLDAIDVGLKQLTEIGKPKSSLAKQLRNIKTANSTFGEVAASLLDDLAGDMIKTIGNKRASGKSVAKDVLEAIHKDMDAMGKNFGINFLEELGTSRAFAALYRNRSRLGEVIGKHGKELDKYRAANPASYREIVKDWASRQLETFVTTNPSGGAQFNTLKFAQWVGKNEKNLNRIMGPEIIKVWQAFPKWDGRLSFVKSIGSRIAEMKTGGVSRLFNRSVDHKMARSIVDALSDPDSPLFEVLLQYADKPRIPAVGLPVPKKTLVGGLEAEFARLGLEDNGN